MNLEPAKKIIREFESLQLKAYYCPAGKLTLGYGHTNPKDVFSDSQATTKEQAEKWLDEDCQSALKDLKNTLVYGSFFNENQINALVSFVFNMGIGKVKNSTLFKLLNEPAAFNIENHEFIAKQFDRWVYSTNLKTRQKEKLPGLVRRREAEKALFLKPVEVEW